MSKVMLFNLFLLTQILFNTVSSQEISPTDLKVYTSESIGEENNEYKGNFIGPAASGGGTYLKNMQGSSTSGQPASLYVNDNLFIQSASLYQGIEAGGNIQGITYFIDGSITGGGNLTGTTGTVTGNVTITGQNTSNTTVYGTVNEGVPFVPSVNYSATTQYYENASTYFGGMAPSTTATNIYGQLVINGLTSGNNVVNLSLGDLQSAWGVSISGPSDAFLIFNFYDTTLTNEIVKALTFSFQGGIGSPNILYNFVNATDLTIRNGSYYSILAPNADITFTGGTLYGNFMSKNLLGSGSFTGGKYLGYSTFAATPEPSTLLILSSLMCFMIFFGKEKIRV